MLTGIVRSSIRPMPTSRKPVSRRWLGVLLAGLAGLAGLDSGALAQDLTPTPASASASAPRGATLDGRPPIVIGHRGAAGHRPEHTLAGYALAIAQGADFIEPDLVLSRDGVLLARHEPLLARVELDAEGQIRRVAGRPVLHRSETSTNVWQLPQFADRLTIKLLDGQRVAGWFVEDFTAAELREHVRAQERLRDLRGDNNAFNDREPIPTLAEVIALARRHGVGLYPETKHPSYFKAFTDAAGLPRMEDLLLAQLHAAWGDRADAPVFIQSFEVGNLQYLRGRTRLRLIQLLAARGRPFDFAGGGDARGYVELASAAGLDFIRSYADGIGAQTALIQQGGRATPLLAEAHARGLAVHGWTFRAENAFLPAAQRRGIAPGARGDLAALLHEFQALGLDGYFCDQPDLCVAALRAPQGGSD